MRRRPEPNSMQPLVIQPGGAYQAALYFSALPLVILVVVWVMRRSQGEVGLWGVGHFGYWPLIVLLVAYYGVIWRWLFHDQFYGVEPESATLWHLQYRMPDREKSLNAFDVADIRAEDLASLTGGTTARIIIEMRDGSRYRSAQVARHRIQSQVAALRALSAHSQVVP